MIKALVFDLDGTLVDTHEFIIQAFEHTLQTHGVPPVARDELIRHVGKPLMHIYEALAPHHIFEDLFETHDAFQHHNLHLIQTYSGVTNTLKELKRRKVVSTVLTNRMTQQSSLASLKAAGIAQYIDLIVCKDDLTYGKPHPEGIVTILKKLRLTPSRVLMVGDTAVDIETGKNAGVKTVAVTYGFGGQTVKDSGPDYVLDRFSQLLGVVKGV